MALSFSGFFSARFLSSAKSGAETIEVKVHMVRNLFIINHLVFPSSSTIALPIASPTFM